MKPTVRTRLYRTVLLIAGLVTALIISTYGQRAKPKAPEGEVTIERIYQSIDQLVHKPEPTFKPYEPQPLDPQTLADLGFDQVYNGSPQRFTMRDAKELFAQRFNGTSNLTIVLLHGMLSSSFTMNKMAGLLREASGATVIALDLRGHGQSAGRPGDVEYMDQFADDLSDVIATIKKEKPQGKIVLAGHSMGGGISLRYAMKKESWGVDGYLLFAPLLGHQSPTLPLPKGTDVHQESFLKIHFERIVGLKLFNALGVHTYDSLPVIFCNMPPGMPLNRYSYRSNASMAPDDYREGLQAVHVPLLVVVGSKDESFVAASFVPAVTQFSKGEVKIINGATHNGVRHSLPAMEEVKAWIKRCNFN